MLFDDEEFHIMAAAAQPQLRLSEPDAKAKRIFEDFFAERRLAGTRVLELGPGQYDFARLVMAAGATVVSIDHDPAVVALGRKRGYEVIHADFLTLDWSSLRGEFHGLFARHSIAPHWFPEPAPLVAFVNSICSTLKRGGWGWLLPWSKYVNTPPAQVNRMLSAQRRAFERRRFTTFYLEGIPDNNILFLKGIDPGPGGIDPRRLED